MSMEISSTNSGVTSQIMELKTSTPGVTRKEEIKTGFKNTNDYSKYLQEKYSYMNTGTTSMQGVPVTVNVSSAFLKKCMDNPEKAAYLEENLAAIPECIKRSVEYTKTMPGNPVMTYCNFSFDESGNITMTSGCTNDPDGKIARENAQRKAEEKKAAEEKAAKRRAEKKEAEEKLAEKRAKKAAEKADKFELTFAGSSVESITQIMTERMMSGNTSAPLTSGLDLKVQGVENRADKIAIPVPKDEYISSGKSGNKPSGLYRMGQDENGNPKVLYDDPKKAEKRSGSQPTSKTEECTTDTDAVDREIEKLKEEKRQLEQQIQAEKDENKVKELEKKLAQVEAELSQKNNDTYRRQNAVVS